MTITCDGILLDDLQSSLAKSFENSDGELRHLANLVLGVALLRQKSREGIAVTSADLELIWGVIRDAVTGLAALRPSYAASRSAQGFLSTPLCSLIEEGRIDELLRLHVWLPDGRRGHADFAIHSHQPFAQSWILAGEATDSSYAVGPATDPVTATHAEYSLAWNDGGKEDANYKTHQTYSVVVNSGKLVNATHTRSEVHSGNMSYSIPAAAFHTSQVEPDVLHATLFFFDSQRGFVQEAGVLGPKDAKSLTQLRDPAGVTPAALVGMVETVRSWENLMERGRRHAQKAEWEHALRLFSSALNLCERSRYLLEAGSYRNVVLGELGSTNRRFGRYEQARDFLEKAISGTRPSAQRVELSGELGVVYRQMNLLEAARRALQMQYDTAKEIGFERGLCRAVGNIGMINYQLYLLNGKDALLDVAIKQQRERISSAQKLRMSSKLKDIEPNRAARWLREANTWESIGHSRLSLCYAARRSVDEAISAARASVTLASSSEDSTMLAMSRFYYGRALLMDGRHAEALQQFNPSGTCTPAIALCKEPSEEHRQYLRELVDAGADMDLVDEQGYKALDYAVFNGDQATELLVLNALRQQLIGDVEHEISQRQNEARLRKGYRELFQELLRPVLLGSRERQLHRLRCVYAEAIAADEEKRHMFDQLKFVRYRDFERSGSLLRSGDGQVQKFRAPNEDGSQGASPDFFIFFSYRWLNKEPGAVSPDDATHTQYKRMLAALEDFLKLHPFVDRENLCIWVDHCCVDQDNPMPGVSALPMIVAQCDALISLVNEDYYERAWCAVEVMMAQTLRTSYGSHLWYEFGPWGLKREGSNTLQNWTLREGAADLEITMADRKLSLEEDRPKVMFLERQARLLG
ncbi:Tetratricopeptide repeat protein 28 [Pleurostoma richardsiae]|uniref:Tetratricopeptide repeat protein 28 n=1 Tax=Pleurostoma richardsiae TaxID=41990 RepID=A0AA38RK01_9PEZI|nr:Tetratricopeptide repeat protein 28 [Pleurostoma richardsiae]